MFFLNKWVQYLEVVLFVWIQISFVLFLLNFELSKTNCFKTQKGVGKIRDKRKWSGRTKKSFSRAAEDKLSVLLYVK